MISVKLGSAFSATRCTISCVVFSMRPSTPMSVITLIAKHGKKVMGITEPVRRAFAGYAWPGNVRELRNMLESMVLLDLDGVLGPDDLPEDSGLLPNEPHAPPGNTYHTIDGADGLVGRSLADVERYYTEKALAIAEGNREVAAKMLNVGERTLYRNLQKWKKDDEERTTGG